VNDAPAIVLGVSRSGPTLLKVLDRHSELAIPTESYFVPPRPTFAQGIAAIYGAYAAARGKPRYGDKTPAYMEHLGLLDRAFPGARYVHIARDGRDAGLSFLAMRRRPRFSWARPRSLAAFAAAWRQEVAAARRFGATTAAGRDLELRYEDLVAEPDRRLRARRRSFRLAVAAARRSPAWRLRRAVLRRSAA
jgi:hypothetical protein